MNTCVAIGVGQWGGSTCAHVQQWHLAWHYCAAIMEDRLPNSGAAWVARYIESLSALTVSNPTTATRHEAPHHHCRPHRRRRRERLADLPAQV